MHDVDEGRVYGSTQDALACGLRDGGLEIATNYPGFHSNELFDKLGGGCTSVNEKAAFAVAWGASVAGKRAAVMFKNVGMNDAADAYLNAMWLGVNAGLVVIVYDDIDMEHSQVRQDSRHYFDFAEGLWFEPRSVEEAYWTARQSFELSERLNTPVVIRVTNILYKRAGGFRRTRREEKPRRFVRDAARFVAHPVHHAARAEACQVRSRAVAAYVESLYQLPRECREGALCVSMGCLPAGVIADENETHVSLFTYPLPKASLEPLVRAATVVRVIEHGDEYVMREVAQMSDLGKCERVGLVSLKPNRRYHCAEDHEKLFAALRGYRNRIVCGDLGEYTNDAHRTIDACLCYGASVGVATGAACGAPAGTQVFCVSGDGAFHHSGRAMLYEALRRSVRFVLVLLDNGGCQGTGGQEVPGSLALEDTGMRVRRFDYATTSGPEFAAAVAEAANCEGIGVLHVVTPRRGLRT